MTLPTPSSDGTRRSGRVFAFTLAGAFAIVALIGLWRDKQLLTMAASVLAAVSLIAGALVPGRLEPVRAAWMKLGELIGSVTTPVLIAAVYYIVLTPTGLLRRLFRRGAKGDERSYWHVRDPAPPKSRMERQF